MWLNFLSTFSLQVHFNNLSFQELNAFYQVCYERAMADPLAKNDPAEQVTIEQWYAQRLEENQLAMRVFNLPVNQLSDEQLYDLNDKQKEGAINGKTSIIDAPNNCPLARFDRNARSTNRRNGAKPDCDCQVAFPTTNNNYRFVFGTTNRMRNLLNRGFPLGFGGSVSRRIVLGGASAGTYVLFGTGRAGLLVGANYTSCRQLSRDVVLSRIPRQ